MEGRTGARPVDDVCHIWKDGHFAFTLRKIAQITGLEIPEAYSDRLDTPIVQLSSNFFPNMGAWKEGELRALFIYFYEEKKLPSYRQYLDQGAILISGTQIYREDGSPYPMIVLASQAEVQAAYCAIGTYIKTVFPMPTIGVTGSIGKTTPKQFLKSIFSERYKVLASGGNQNTPDLFTNQLIRQCDPTYEFHIQECGAGVPGLVERAAKMLRADAFCITNILPHHLDRYDTLEDILYDKASFDRVPGKTCFGVINIDDGRLRDYAFQNRIVTCGVTSPDADYVAGNIRQSGLYLEMDVTYRTPDGEERTVPIRVSIPGLHNANGAVMAFAMAKEWGFTDEEIQRGFLNYKSDGIRQSLRVTAGRLLYVDCFNVASGSIRSSLSTLESFELEPGCRRVAVLGGENLLGSREFANNYAVGLTFRDFHVDEYIFVGRPEPATEEEYNLFGHSYALYQGARRALRGRVKTSFMTDYHAIADKLAAETKPGDVILFKGGFRLAFPSIIDLTFGTSGAVYFPYHYFPPYSVAEDGFRASYFPSTDTCNLMRCTIRKGVARIPDTVDGRPVARVSARLCRDNPYVQTIDFGLSCANIGAECFAGCTALRAADIPANVLYIEAGAFAGCPALEHVSVRGALHIERGAFRDCPALRAVEISGDCVTIEEDVFAGSPNVTIAAPAGSAAAAYARDHGIPLAES